MLQVISTPSPTGKPSREKGRKPKGSVLSSSPFSEPPRKSPDLGLPTCTRLATLDYRPRHPIKPNPSKEHAADSLPPQRMRFVEVSGVSSDPDKRKRPPETAGDSRARDTRKWTKESCERLYPSPGCQRTSGLRTSMGKWRAGRPRMKRVDPSTTDQLARMSPALLQRPWSSPSSGGGEEYIRSSALANHMDEVVEGEESILVSAPITPSREWAPFPFQDKDFTYWSDRLREQDVPKRYVTSKEVKARDAPLRAVVAETAKAFAPSPPARRESVSVSSYWADSVTTTPSEKPPITPTTPEVKSPTSSLARLRRGSQTRLWLASQQERQLAGNDEDSDDEPPPTDGARLPRPTLVANRTHRVSTEDLEGLSKVTGRKLWTARPKSAGLRSGKKKQIASLRVKLEVEDEPSALRIRIPASAPSYRPSSAPSGAVRPTSVLLEEVIEELDEVKVDEARGEKEVQVAHTMAVAHPPQQLDEILAAKVTDTGPLLKEDGQGEEEEQQQQEEEHQHQQKEEEEAHNQQRQEELILHEKPNSVGEKEQVDVLASSEPVSPSMEPTNDEVPTQMLSPVVSRKATVLTNQSPASLPGSPLFNDPLKLEVTGLSSPSLGAMDDRWTLSHVDFEDSDIEQDGHEEPKPDTSTKPTTKPSRVVRIPSLTVNETFDLLLGVREAPSESDGEELVWVKETESARVSAT